MKELIIMTLVLIVVVAWLCTADGSQMTIGVGELLWIVLASFIVGGIVTVVSIVRSIYRTITGVLDRRNHEQAGLPRD